MLGQINYEQSQYSQHEGGIKLQKNIQIDVPNSVYVYNKHMGGIDLFDQQGISVPHSNKVKEMVVATLCMECECTNSQCLVSIQKKISWY